MANQCVLLHLLISDQTEAASPFNGYLVVFTLFLVSLPHCRYHLYRPTDAHTHTHAHCRRLGFIHRYFLKCRISHSNRLFMSFLHAHYKHAFTQKLFLFIHLYLIHDGVKGWQTISAGCSNEQYIYKWCSLLKHYINFCVSQYLRKTIQCEDKIFSKALKLVME